MIAGLSYGARTGGSLAYPINFRRSIWPQPDHDMLCIVLELVHPGNLGVLPPSPSMVAYKGEQIGVAKYSEFFRR